MKLLKNKKGYSTAMAWVFGLVSIFGLGILYIVFSQVFNSHLVPIITEQVDNGPLSAQVDNATKQEIYNGIDKYMAIFNMMPFILIFVVIIYMIVAAVRKEREEEQF